VRDPTSHGALRLAQVGAELVGDMDDREAPTHETDDAPVQNEKARHLPPRLTADISASADMSAELLRHRLVSPPNTHLAKA